MTERHETAHSLLESEEAESPESHAIQVAVIHVRGKLTRLYSEPNLDPARRAELFELALRNLDKINKLSQKC